MRRTLALALTAVVSAGVMLGSVGAALGVPLQALIAGYGDATRLDYAAAGGGTFSPLSDRFLESILGHLLPGAPLPPARGLTASAPAPPARAVAAGSVSYHKVDVTHAFTNGTFGDAYIIPSVPFTGRTNTSGASRETGEPGNCPPVGGVAWYRYTPPVDMALVANTFGTTYATALAVFTGTSLANLAQTGTCSTDPQGNAQVGFLARGGITYYFQISGPAGGGNLVFNLDPVGETELTSVTASGQEANDSVFFRQVTSPDGRYVLFASFATDLAPMGRDCKPPNVCQGLFLRDRVAGTTSLVVATSYPGTGPLPHTQTADLEAAQGQVSCCLVVPGSMTPDGRYVAFTSTDKTLVGDKTNQFPDVFVIDRVTGHVERDSVTSDGSEAHGGPNFGSQYPSISADGRFVLFSSEADNLGVTTGGPLPWVPTRTHDPAVRVTKAFVHDRLTGRTEPVSIGPNGAPLPDDSNTCFGDDLSADGRFAVFWSGAGRGLTDQPTTPIEVYLRDLSTHSTVLVSRNAAGQPGDYDSACPAISADGSHVAFRSGADNLAPGPAGEAFYEWDRQTQAITQLNPTEPATVNNSGDGSVSLSSDGRYAAFSSDQALVPEDRNSKSDCFVHDLVTGSTVRVSVSSTGLEGDDASMLASISGDGTLVSFESYATDFASSSTPGRLQLYVHRLIR